MLLAQSISIMPEIPPNSSIWSITKTSSQVSQINSYWILGWSWGTTKTAPLMMLSNLSSTLLRKFSTPITSMRTRGIRLIRLSRSITLASQMWAQRRINSKQCQFWKSNSVCMKTPFGLRDSAMGKTRAWSAPKRSPLYMITRSDIS
jgi:hypothetical protein